MPSTYSNLKIQLMATGENTTTWGTVTNLNLGTALEEAIVGSADVTFASDNVTLTLADTNASQTARNMRLRCTGTTGGSTRNLVVPSIEKPYIVQNDCADSVVVKTSAGTGVTVPAGKTMWVYSDGTNVVDAVTNLTSLTLGAALPISSGGTGSTSTTYCNLQANVAGTLPILNGGTGSTSTTYCNLQANVTGILPLERGGTGQNTAPLARTALGATTVGGNMFTLTNPSAVTFPRFNADNTVSALDAAAFRTAIGAGSGGGTVTSVAALTLGTTGTDLSSTVADSTTTPVITLNVPTASAANRGVLSAADWTTFNSKAASGANTDITSLSPTGSLTLNPTTGTLVGAPTGGVQGAGTINATGLFVNGVAVGVGSGSVSSVSVVSANGFAGTVANASTTPAITLTTSITGVLKGNGTAISAAVAGTDYVLPGGALGTPSSGTLTNCTFPTLNQNTTGSAATLTTARTFTIGATGRSFNGSANVTWTLTDIGAAASGANTDITALDQDVTVTATGTIAANTIGYRGIPQNAQSSTYTFALSDAGKHVYSTNSGAQTITVPTNAAVALPVGTAVTIVNNGTTAITFTTTSVTVYKAGTSTAWASGGTLAVRGMVTWLKVATDTWFVSGSGLS